MEIVSDRYSVVHPYLLSVRVAVSIVNQLRIVTFFLRSALKGLIVVLCLLWCASNGLFAEASLI